MSTRTYYWQATVQYVVDGTTHERTFTGHRIFVQIFPGRTPRRAVIGVTNRKGVAVETFQCDYLSVHRMRVRGK